MMEKQKVKRTKSEFKSTMPQSPCWDDLPKETQAKYKKNTTFSHSNKLSNTTKADKAEQISIIKRLPLNKKNIQILLDQL